MEDNKVQPKLKRDIFRFKGAQDIAINIEHVTHISLTGNKITFSFYNQSFFVEEASEEDARGIYEQMLSFWASEA
jgi:hypothetical protein